MVRSAGGGGGRPATRIRSEIADAYKWNLADVYPSWEAWQEDLVRLKELADDYRRFRNTLGASPEQLLEAHLAADELFILAYRIFQYPNLMSYEDTRDNAVAARLQEVKIVISEFRKATAWFKPELLTIPEEKMQRWLEQSPALAPYRFPITEVYRTQRHVLDEHGERLLAYAAQFNATPDETYTMLADADVSYPTITLSNGEEVVASYGNISHILHTNRNQADREAVFKAFSGVFKASINTYAAIYNSLLQRDWFMSQARQYPSCLEDALDEDAIPAAVVEGLIATARANTEPLQRYHRLRRQVLGLERYRYFDAYLPLIDLEWEVPYDTVREIVVSSVAVFGPDYQETVERAFRERWIDVYENEGKRSGAFSAGVYGVHPFMMLNYSDTVTDAFTVAHEMGHTLHTVLSYAHQPFATCFYAIFVAEVASMVNEDLFLDELLARETDAKRRVTLLQLAIDEIAASFYRQCIFASFELSAHQRVERGEPITATSLQELYLGILEEFFGDCLDDNDWYAATWAQVPHFFASPFYVYQYATAKAATCLMHRRLTGDDQQQRELAVAQYRELLKAGGSDHPVALLKRAGVDFTTGEPIEALVAFMDRLVSQLEQELTALGMVKKESTVNS